jgi:hypothetical protein
MGIRPSVRPCPSVRPSVRPGPSGSVRPVRVRPGPSGSVRPSVRPVRPGPSALFLRLHSEVTVMYWWGYETRVWTTAWARPTLTS